VSKLEELKAMLATLDSFRFYTSSLLLVYEGLDPDFAPDEEEESSSRSEDCSMNSMDIDDCSPEEDSGSGLCSTSKIKNSNKAAVGLGPTSFLGMIPSSKSEDEICGRGNRQQKLQQNPSLAQLRGNAYYSMDSPDFGGTSTACCSTDAAVGSKNSSKINNSSLSLESVDVRMIDFAHATHSGLENNSGTHQEHSGPDAGYIFGLSNLIQVLRGIIKEQNMEF
jgi:hypothetical protein